MMNFPFAGEDGFFFFFLSFFLFHLFSKPMGTQRGVAFARGVWRLFFYDTHLTFAAQLLFCVTIVLHTTHIACEDRHEVHENLMTISGWYYMALDGVAWRWLHAALLSEELM